MRSIIASTTGLDNRKTTFSIIFAVILTALGAGSYMSWTAQADEQPVNLNTEALVAQPILDVDSLYQAKADEPTTIDSSYVLAIDPDRTLSGKVSWYGPGFHGRKTANGERFDKNEMTAAHKSLPFGTLVRVVDNGSGRSVLVRINDRGPYCGGRILDLSEEAARRLGITARGTGSARLEIYGRDATTPRSFDADGRAITLHGYTVKLRDIVSFDEAIAFQLQVREQGQQEVFLTQLVTGGKTTYRVSVGLFSSASLCSSVLAEVNQKYVGEVVRFEKGAETTTAKASAPAEL